MPYIDFDKTVVAGSNMDKLSRFVSLAPGMKIHYTPGDDPNASLEDVAGQIVEAFHAVERGEYEDITPVSRGVRGFGAPK